MSETMFSGGDIASAAATMESSTPASSEATPVSTPDPTPAQTASPTGDRDPATTVQADAPVTTPVVESKGPIPFNTHKTALDNARTKAASEAEAKYAWVNEHNVTPDSVQTMHSVRDQMVNDPGAFLADYFTAVINAGEPEHIKAIRQIAARVLGQRSQPAAQTAPAAPAEEPTPDIPIQDESGRITGYVYSAAQQAKREAWLKSSWMAEVDQRFAPLKATQAELEEQKRAVEYDRQATQWTTQTLTALRARPHFKENEVAIKAVFARMGNVPDARVGEALRDAYLEVLTTQVLPKLGQTERAAVMKQLQQKPAASSANPNGARAATPNAHPSNTSWEDDLRLEWQRRHGATA